MQQNPTWEDTNVDAGAAIAAPEVPNIALWNAFAVW